MTSETKNPDVAAERPVYRPTPKQRAVLALFGEWAKAGLGDAAVLHGLRKALGVRLETKE